MRFLAAKIQRAKTFFDPRKQSKNWPLSYEDLLSIAERIQKDNISKIKSRERKKIFKLV